MKKYVKCIACNGKGHILRPVVTKVTEKQKKVVLQLYRKGVGLREIARQTKIKHPQSVKHVIKNANQK